MGFRCPICLKDFGKNKEEWQEHITTSHFGAGDDCVKFIKKVAGDNAFDIDKEEANNVRDEK